MRPRRFPLVCSLLAFGPAVGSATAQTAVALELGASQIGPAVGSDLDDARFGIGGLRFSTFNAGGSGLFASLLGGQVFGDSVGGSFISALVEATAREQWTQRWSGAVDVRFLTFGVRDPFPYRTWATELGPSIQHRTPRTSVEIGLLAGVGESRIEWQPIAGPAEVFEDAHWRVGSTAELLFGSPTVQVGVAGSTHRASEDQYHSLGARFVVGGSWGIVELRADRWDTPLGFETTGGITLAVPFGGWSVRSFLGRSDPDPLTLAQPGSSSGGVLIGRTLFSTADDSDRERNALYEVIRYSESSSRVRLAVEAPSGATRVEVLGDFTLWTPVPMQRVGNRWIAEVDVTAGTHHFGFMVDDEWFVPDDAPDVVPDEWGRLSATLVIEGAGS